MKPESTTARTDDRLEQIEENASSFTEPHPAFAFSKYAKIHPALREISELTGHSFEKIQSPQDFGFSIQNVEADLERVPKPLPLYENNPNPIKRLIGELAKPELSIDQQTQIQKDILKFKCDINKPISEHQEKITRLKVGLNQAVASFSDWVENDPAGISAVAHDKTYNEWIEADKKRRAQEERDAREKIKREIEVSELKDQIGSELLDFDLMHPDIDKNAISDFFGFFEDYEEPPQCNCILTGPSGTGKSRALAQAAISYCRLMGRGENFIEWITGYEFAELITELASERREAANFRLKEVSDAYMLFFDDLGSAHFTAARMTHFFRLIDNRYRKGFHTLFTTNYSTAQLKKHFTKSGGSSEDAARILRRIIGTPATPLAKFFHFKRQDTNPSN
jgi:DNA replication protein DnaC